MSGDFKRDDDLHHIPRDNTILWLKSRNPPVKAPAVMLLNVER